MGTSSTAPGCNSPQVSQGNPGAWLSERGNEGSSLSSSGPLYQRELPSTSSLPGKSTLVRGSETVVSGEKIKFESHRRWKVRWTDWSQSTVTQKKGKPKESDTAFKYQEKFTEKRFWQNITKTVWFVPQDSKTLSILQRWTACLRKQWIRTGTFSHLSLGGKKKKAKEKKKKAVTKASSQDPFWEPNAKSWL